MLRLCRQSSTVGLGRKAPAAEAQEDRTSLDRSIRSKKARALRREKAEGLRI